VVEPCWHVELRVHDLSRQPHVVRLEHLAKGQSHGAEDFRLRNLVEADVCAVTDDAGEINVAPADVLGNDEWRSGHVIAAAGNDAGTARTDDRITRCGFDRTRHRAALPSRRTVS